MEEAAVPAQQFTFVLKSSLPPEVLARERERFIKPERNPESARLWNELETNLLLDLVERNYQFLTGPLHPGKNRKKVTDKWEAITNKVNALGLSSRPLKLEQVKKKWHDLKSLSKKELNKLVESGEVRLRLVNDKLAEVEMQQLNKEVLLGLADH